MNQPGEGGMRKEYLDSKMKKYIVSIVIPAK